MGRYGNLGAFDYKVTNVPQYDLFADVDKAIALGIQQGTALGKGIASGKAERQKEIANQIALDKLDKATREGLILPADSGVNSLNDARIEFSKIRAYFSYKKNIDVLIKKDFKIENIPVRYYRGKNKSKNEVLPIMIYSQT